MITPNDLHTDSDAELPKMLGEVLQPEGNKHRLFRVGGATGQCYKGKHYCKKCKCVGNYWILREEDCLVFDPIPLEWNVAMKFFEAGIEKHGKPEMIEAMKEVYIAATGDTNGGDYVMNWWIPNAGSIGHLKAAAICELKKASE